MILIDIMGFTHNYIFNNAILSEYEDFQALSPAERMDLKVKQG